MTRSASSAATNAQAASAPPAKAGHKARSDNREAPTEGAI
jgi:hypothetical protein